MANRLDPKDFGLKLYNLFPPSYRLADADQRYALRRYLEAASDGGFKYVIEEQNGILDLIDPHTASMDVVHYLYEQYGLNLFHGIPEEFLRSFLPNLGAAWAKKGSLDVIEYMVSSLSGIKTTTDVSYDEFENPIITVRIEMDVTASNYFPNAKQFERLVQNFIPYYCDPRIVYSYVYAERADLKTLDTDFMRVNEQIAEIARMFYSAGERYADGYNTEYQTGHILLPEKEIQFNRKIVVPFDPDVLVMDRIGFKDHDVATSNRSILPNSYDSRFNDILSLFNTSLVYNDYVETDSYKERFFIVPVTESAKSRAEDKTDNTVRFMPSEDSATIAHPDSFFMNRCAFNSGKCFCVIENDTIEDTFILTKVDESGSVSRNAEEMTEDVVMGLVHENTSTKGIENLTDKYKDTYSDVSEVSKCGDIKKTNQSTYGKSSKEGSDFNFYGDRSDVFRDLLTVTVSESAAVNEKEWSALTNSKTGFNVFRFNMFQCVDVITRGSVREAVFS